MQIASYVISIITGIALGFLYGLSFLATEKKALFAASNLTNPSMAFSTSVVKRMARIIIFALSYYYLLHHFGIHSILLLLFFFIAFWLIILTKREPTTHGKI